MKKTIGGENHFAANRFYVQEINPDDRCPKFRKKERPPGDR
jgi:hypothetical protein